MSRKWTASESMRPRGLGIEFVAGVPNHSELEPSGGVPHRLGGASEDGGVSFGSPGCCAGPLASAPTPCFASSPPTYSETRGFSSTKQTSGSTAATRSADPSNPGSVVGACNDGIDNDGDGLIDVGGDPDCNDASSNRELAIPVRNCSVSRNDPSGGVLWLAMIFLALRAGTRRRPGTPSSS